MSAQSQAETMKNNRAASIARRPPGWSGPDAGPSRMSEGVRTIRTAAEIEVDRIIPDADQPRKEFDQDALDRLAASLKARGQLQPIRVRWSEESGHYVVVVGERRWRAARIAGMTSIACIVVQGELSPEDLLEDQLIENAIREDLKPIEQAMAYKAIMEAQGLTHRELAERLHIAHTGITRALGLLDLPEPVRAQVDSGELPARSAYAIASKVDDPAEQIEIAARVVADGLNREETIEAVRKAKARKPAAKGRGAAKAKPRKVTERAFRTEAGFRVTVEFKRGLDDASIRVALLEVLAQIPAEAGDDQVAA
jgi:ParB family transcriptional regulator, chromosome partitioning protein